MSLTLVIGSRGSKLALWQAEQVRSTIQLLNPEIEVRYGPQSWDEMAVTFLGYVVDAKASPGRVFSGPGRGGVAPIE